MAASWNSVQIVTLAVAMYATTEADPLLRAPIECQWGSRRNLAWWHDSMSQ